MKCIFCKSSIPDSVKFCPECGKAIPKLEPIKTQQLKQFLPIVTLQQCADFLQVSKPTIYKLLEEGLPWFPVGRDKRFIIDEVLRWAKTRQKGA